jgi:Fe-S-cluster containining protein
MECRKGCGACCIAMAIESPIPGMPAGKKTGVPCVQLAADYSCKLFGKPQRPQVCLDYPATPQLCGVNREEALILLS